MKLEDFSFRLGNKELKPLIIGGMGVNISTREMALEAARLGGIGHISDAMLPSVCDKILGTNFTSKKAKAQRIYMNSIDKSQDVISSEMLREAALLYTRPIMEQKKGDGLVFVNCMEKLTMNDPLRTLKARLNALMDAGIDGITLGAGLHMASLSLMEDNPRFRDVKIGIMVSSVRALKLFLRRATKHNRMPDYVIVEGPLAGGHLGFGMDWANYSLMPIFKEVKEFLANEGHPDIPVIAAGGIFTESDAVEFMKAGAAAVQVATRFTVAQESGLPHDVKQAYFNAKPEDIEVNTISTTGYPMRMLKYSPAIGSAVRPNCETYGYLLEEGKCSYLTAWLDAAGGTFDGPTPKCVQSKTCLCTQMRNFKVWTCGAKASRLHQTSVRGSDGLWVEPSTEHIFNDYMKSENGEIAVPSLKDQAVPA